MLCSVDVPNLVEIVLPKSLRLIDIQNVNESGVFEVIFM